MIETSTDDRRDIKVLILGAQVGSGVGGSLHRASLNLGLLTSFVDTKQALSPHRMVNSFFWRALDRSLPHMNRVEASAASAVWDEPADLVLTVGILPASEKFMQFILSNSKHLAIFLTDSPNNRRVIGKRGRESLQFYDSIFSPRSQSISDLEKLCRGKVFHLPFGYDPLLLQQTAPFHVGALDVLFVGGGDQDRVQLLSELLQSGLNVGLVGGYWNRFAASRRHWLGHHPIGVVNSLTQKAKLNLCLVRRANGDEHTMRTFEIAALGGAMLVERTNEHLALFGPEGECVFYFDSPKSLLQRATELLKEPERLRRMGQAVQSRILSGGHTYSDRLMKILEVVKQGTQTARVKRVS